MRWVLALVALPLATTAAQQPAGGGERCQMQILNVDREGTQVEVIPGVVNYFLGGNVRLRCVRQPIFMSSDSVASYQGRIVQFIGSVRYRDTTVEMTSRYGTYLRDGEKWEARDDVVLRNLKEGTELRSPSLDYWRAQAGVRDSAELLAERRATITIPVRDSAGVAEDPYLVVADRVRIVGSTQFWAGGRVTIDRIDFQGRGDSLYLDTGTRGEGALIGSASARRTAADSFDLTGDRIDLRLENRELTYVTARDSARLRTGTLELVGDAIGLDLEERKVQQALAWGDSVRPVAVAEDYVVRGDSLAFDTPEQELREIRAFGGAWLGTAADSAEERDWVSGDTVRASFAPRDTADGRPSLKELESRGSARALYRMALAGQSEPSLEYMVADQIRILMRLGDTVTVDSVWALGVKDGVHLQPALRPAAARPDTAARRDTVPPPPRPRRRERRR